MAQRRRKPTLDDLDVMLGREHARIAYQDAGRAEARRMRDCIDPERSNSQPVTLTIEGGLRPAVKARLGDGQEVSLLFSPELRAYLLRELEAAADRHKAVSREIRTAIDDYGTGKRKPKRDWRGRLCLVDG